MEKFDLIVIGGGPGGYLAAERAAKAGLKTLVIEKNKLGGVCLNEGCIPSKTLLNSAKILDYAKHGAAYGVNVPDGAYIDQKKVIDRKNYVVRKLVAGVKLQLKNAGATVLQAEAVIDSKTVDGYKVVAGDASYLADKLLIATGSVPVLPKIDGLAESLEAGFAVTSREILDFIEVPEKLVVVGGGVVGLEMASYFASVGSKVTVVEMLEKIAGGTEKEISEILKKALEKKGIDFKLGCKVTKIRDGKVSFERDGTEDFVDADKVLVSIGRKPKTDGLGIENISINLEKGAILTNERMRTNVPNVYAAGDVNGKVMLAHTAYREAEVAVNNMLGKEDVIRYDLVPSVIYTSPEVASVGETLDSALEKGLDVTVTSLPLTYSGRYVAENTDMNGLCKLVINNKTNTLVGAHILGPYASEYILAVAAFVGLSTDIESIKKIVFPHPTVCEIIRESLFSL